MKKLITISVLFVLLILYFVFAPNYVFATIENNPTVTNDSNYQVIEMFHSLDSQFCVILENPATSGKSTIFPYLSMGKPYLWFIDNTNESKMYLAFYNESTPILGGYNITIYNNNNSTITCDGYKINTVATFRIDFSNLSIAYVNGSQDLYTPCVTYNYFGDSLIQTMRNLGWIGEGSSLGDLRNGLSAINSSVVQEGNETQNAINSSAQATQNAINSSAQATQNAINSSAQATQNVINSSAQATQNSINSTAQATQNTINSTAQATQNAINSQSQQQQNNYNAFTNTTYFDNTVTNIDVADLYGNVTSVGADEFLFRVYDLLTEGFTTRTRSTTVTIPLPYNMDPIILDSTPIVNFYETYYVIGELVRVFWTYVFGVYYFKFVKRIWTWIATGEVLNANSFMKELNNLNANITKEMM